MSGKTVLTKQFVVKSPLFPSIGACRLSSLIDVTPAEAGEHSFKQPAICGLFALQGE